MKFPGHTATLIKNYGYRPISLAVNWEHASGEYDVRQHQHPGLPMLVTHLGTGQLKPDDTGQYVAHTSNGAIYPCFSTDWDEALAYTLKIEQMLRSACTCCNDRGWVPSLPGYSAGRPCTWCLLGEELKAQFEIGMEGLSVEF